MGKLKMECIILWVGTSFGRPLAKSMSWVTPINWWQAKHVVVEYWRKSFPWERMLLLQQKGCCGKSVFQQRCVKSKVRVKSQSATSQYYIVFGLNSHSLRND